MTSNFIQNVWNWLKENPLSTIGSFASVASLILTLVSYNNDINVPQFIIIRDLLLFGGMFALCVFFVIKQRLYLDKNIILEKKIENKKDEILDLPRSIFNQYNQIAKKYGHIVFELENQDSDVTDYKDKNTKFEKQFNRLAHIVTMALVEVAEQFLKLQRIEERCSVTIKLLKPDLDARDLRRWEVYTAYRDPVTYKEGVREIKEKQYIIEENSAFRHIAYDGNEFFCHNNLKGLGVIYNNKTENWQKLYNATFVVPISHKTMHYGFLAIDSKNKCQEELFSEKWCLPLLNSASEQIKTYLLRYQFIA